MVIVFQMKNFRAKAWICYGYRKEECEMKVYNIEEI